MASAMSTDDRIERLVDDVIRFNVTTIESLERSINRIAADDAGVSKDEVTDALVARLADEFTAPASIPSGIAKRYHLKMREHAHTS